MAVWPLLDASGVETGGAVLGTSVQTTVTAGAAHVKGAWAEMIAATDFDVTRLQMVFTGTHVSAADTCGLLDVGIGAAAAEMVIVPDVQMGNMDLNMRYHMAMPIRVPVGSRLSLRHQNATASKAITAQLVADGGGFSPQESGSRAITYGVDAATSGGTAPTAATAANTKSAWTVLSASTTAPSRFALLTMGLTAGTAVTATTGFVDIGVGAAAAEAVVIPNVYFEVLAAESIRYQHVVVPLNLPAATRLVFRYQATSIVAAARPRVTVTLFS